MTRKIINKIVLIGDGAVGKTSLIRKFVHDKFEDKYITTIGTKVTKKSLNFKSDIGEDVELTLMIWDLLGQKGFHKVQTSALGTSQGLALLMSIISAI